MPHHRKTLWLLLACLIGTGASGQQEPPSASKAAPTTADASSIYRTFFAGYVEHSKTTTNVADMTEPFRADDDERKGCLKAFPPANTAEVHRITPDVLAGLPAKLVDPHLHEKRDPWDAIRKGQSVDDAVDAGFEAGIFTFSEVLFNKDRTKAAMQFSFVCGGLCGHGGTVLLEKRNGKWMKSKLRCSSWIS